MKKRAKMEKSKKHWGTVNREISRSKITRYPWKDLLGGTALTRHTEKLILKGYNCEEIIEMVLRNPKIVEFMKFGDIEKKQKNLRTTISSQFCESKMKRSVEIEGAKNEQKSKNNTNK